MTSTVGVDQLTDSAGANLVTLADLFGNRVKAWGVLNGTGTPALAAYSGLTGVVTDNGTGDWTLTLSTPMTSTNFAIIGSTGTANVTFSAKAVTTTTFRIKTATGTTAALVDDAVVAFLVLGTEDI